jgi:hypothetical protein
MNSDFEMTHPNIPKHPKQTSNVMIKWHNLYLTWRYRCAIRVLWSHKHPPQPDARHCQAAAASGTVSEANLPLPSHRSRAWGVGKCHEKPHCDLKRNTWKGHSYHVLSRILRKCIFLSFLLGTIHLYVLWHWWFDKPPIYGNVGDVFLFNWVV